MGTHSFHPQETNTLKYEDVVNKNFYRTKLVKTGNWPESELMNEKEGQSLGLVDAKYYV